MRIRVTGWGASPCIMSNLRGEKQLAEFTELAGDLLYVSAAHSFTRADTGSSGTWELGGDGEPEDERRGAAER
jgi:hypothetical protein